MFTFYIVCDILNCFFDFDMLYAYLKYFLIFKFSRVIIFLNQYSSSSESFVQF